MKEKFIKKYMRRAKHIADDQNPCLSRAIGSVIVDPIKNIPISDGYNGPAQDVPHSDTFAFLSEYVYPQLTTQDKEYISKNHGVIAESNIKFASAFEGCKICPRKLVGAISGERLELCSCAHSESNAIANAAKGGYSTFGCYIFCWCSIPCWICTNNIINAGLSRVYCLTDECKAIDNMYNSNLNKWRLEKSSVKVIQLNKEWILKE